MLKAKIEENAGWPEKETRNVFSHIKGLGVGDFYNIRYQSQGLIGQIVVRRALFMIVDLINRQNFENKGVFVTGPSGTGKTSLCTAISKHLNPKFPFLKINASEIYFSGKCNIDILHQAIRKTIGINFYQESLLLEGQVVQIKTKKTDNNLTYKIALKNENVQGIYKIGPKLYRKLLEQKIEKGDRISIDKANCEIYCHKKYTDHEDNDKFFDPTEKSCLKYLEKYKIIEHFITLAEIDALNVVGKNLSNVFPDINFQFNLKKKEKIDKILNSWDKKNKIKILKGILFVDDVHLLDADCYSFLGKIIESRYAPNFVFVTSCEKKKINGLKYTAPHGVPVDLLDRFFILSTHPSSSYDIEQILNTKLVFFELFLEKECSILMVKIGLECGINYMLNLLTMISLMIRKMENKVTLTEIKSSYKMFLDFRKFIKNTNTPKYFLFQFRRTNLKLSDIN